MSNQRPPDGPSSWTGTFEIVDNTWEIIDPVTTYTATIVFYPISTFTGNVVSLPSGRPSASITVTFTTTRALRLRVSPATYEGTTATFPVTPSYTGTVYYRWGRAGRPLTETGTFPGTSGDVERVRLFDVFPNRDLQTQTCLLYTSPSPRDS